MHEMSESVQRWAPEHLYSLKTKQIGCLQPVPWGDQESMVFLARRLHVFVCFVVIVFPFAGHGEMLHHV